MSDPIDNTTPPAVPEPEHTLPAASTSEASTGGWTTTHTGHAEVPPGGYSQNYGAPPPGGYAQPVAANNGLSDSTIGVLAYITFIPAVIFLLVEPYKNKSFVRFHAIQELGLTVCSFVLQILLVIPFLGWLLWVVGHIVLLVLWLLCVLKASQGGSYKLPFIGKFAAEQSGYNV